MRLTFLTCTCTASLLILMWFRDWAWYEIFFALVCLFLMYMQGINDGECIPIIDDENEFINPKKNNTDATN